MPYRKHLKFIKGQLTTDKDDFNSFSFGSKALGYGLALSNLERSWWRRCLSRQWRSWEGGRQCRLAFAPLVTLFR